MFSKLRNNAKVVNAWDRTPTDYTGSIFNDVNHMYIPAPLKHQIIRSGVNLEIFKTEEAEPISALLIWSPKNNGTLHVDLNMFEKLRFLDRMVLLRLSLDIHRHYTTKKLTLTEKDIIWKGEVFTGTWLNCMSLYHRGLVKSAMDMLGDLPWLVSGRPSLNAEDAQSSHRFVLEAITKIGHSKGPDFECRA